MKKILISTGSFALLVMPVMALAANVPKLDSYLGQLIYQAINLLRSLLVLLISLAVVWFIWNVIKYAMSNEDDGKEKAKSQMINGIIAIAVIVSIWGIVALLQGAFGVQNTGFQGNLDGMIPGGSGGGSGSGFNFEIRF